MKTLAFLLSLLLSPLFLAFNVNAEVVKDDVLPGYNYSQVFKTYTGSNPTDNFSAYSIISKNNQLYMGFSAGWPASNDGALLTSFRPRGGVKIIGALKEQGLHNMEFIDNTLYIAGTDPCCGSNQNVGAVYRYKGNKLSKYAGIPDSLHVWGLEDDGDNILVTTSNVHAGKVYKANKNSLNTWELVSQPDYYRIYDIAKLGSKIFATFNTSSDKVRVKISSDGGNTWRSVLGIDDVYVSRFVKFQDKLLLPDNAKNRIHIINSSGQVVSKSIPFNLYAYYNTLAQSDDKYVYAVDINGKAYATTDLTNWRLIGDFGQQVYTLAYWEGQQALVGATRGKNMKIYKFDLSTFHAQENRAFLKVTSPRNGATINTSPNNIYKFKNFSARNMLRYELWLKKQSESEYALYIPQIDHPSQSMRVVHREGYTVIPHPREMTVRLTGAKYQLPVGSYNLKVRMIADNGSSYESVPVSFTVR